MDYKKLGKLAGCSDRTARRLCDADPFLKNCEESTLVDLLKLPKETRKLEIERLKKEQEEKNKPVYDIKTHEKTGLSICLPENFAEETGQRAALARFEAMERAAASEVARLLKLRHPDYKLAVKFWGDCQELWLKAAKDTPKALLALDNSISREEFEKTLATVLGSVDRLLAGLPAKISSGGQMLTRELLEKLVESEISIIRDTLFNGEIEEKLEESIDDSEK